MKENDFYDVVILGAGIAGSLCAYQLINKGYKVALIEKNAQPKRKICGEYICPDGVKFLEELGLSDSLVGRRSIMGMKLVSPSGIEVDTFFPKRNSNKYSIGKSIERGLFEKDIISKSIKLGLDFFPNTKIDKLIQDGNGHWTASDGQNTWRGKLLIGADGIQSIVAKTLNLNKKSEHRKIAIHAHLQRNNLLPDLGQMHVLRNGMYVGLNPISNQEINFSLVLDKKFFDNSNGVNTFVRNLIDSYPILKKQIANIEETDHFNVLMPISKKVKSIIGKNAVLMGDAAGFLDPLTGEGMYSAIKMSKLLAEQIDLDNIEQSLSSYQTLKIQFFKNKIQINKIFQLIIKSSIMSNLIGHFLKTHQYFANQLIGLIGNIYTPKTFIQSLFLKFKNKGY